MVPTIPPEIWITTAEFIPSSILQNLYSVSPVFLHLALNEKYGDISFGTTWSPQSAKYLKHINHPHIANRVKRLTLCSNWINHMSESPPQELFLWTTLASYLPFNLGRFIDPILHRRSNIDMCNTLLQNAVLNFPNLSSLTIFDVPHTRPDPVVVNAYTACASNLRSLSLCSVSPNFDTTIPPNASDFTSLEEVTIIFSPRVGCSADTVAVSTFFRAIASSLTSLNISSVDTSEEPLTLFQSFPTFPKLTSFSLSHSDPPASRNPILMQFLNQHAGTLKNLRLQHVEPSPIQVASKSLQLPVLPHLESLDILDGSSYRHRQKLPSPEGLDAALAYVQHSTSTLTSLGLTHCSFSFHDIGTLLDLLGKDNSEELKSLSVTVQVLSPDLLDMLAEKLPQLIRLKINFTYLRRAADQDVPTHIIPEVTQEDFDSFLLEMKKRSYSEWALRCFGFGHDGERFEMAMTILMSLGLCIPRLVEIKVASMELWRELGSTWRARNNLTRISLDVRNLSIGLTGLDKGDASKEGGLLCN